MKCPFMCHLIWVFTLSQSTHLGVSSLQRVDYNKEGKDQETIQSSNTLHPGYHIGNLSIFLMICPNVIVFYAF